MKYDENNYTTPFQPNSPRASKQNPVRVQRSDGTWVLMSAKAFKARKKKKRKRKASQLTNKFKNSKGDNANIEKV